MNMLGIRETNIYGQDTYEEVKKYIKKSFINSDIQLDFVQSNYEGKIVDEIQNCYFEHYDGIVINPASYTHTSIAILDALKATKIPAVEVHMSDLTKREEFRQKSYITSYCIKRIVGLGKDSYVEAIKILINYLGK